MRTVKRGNQLCIIIIDENKKQPKNNMIQRER